MLVAEQDLSEIFTQRFGQPVRNSGELWVMYRCPECQHRSLACNVQHGHVLCHFCGWRERAQGQSVQYTKREYNLQAQHAIIVWCIKNCGLTPAYKQFLDDRNIRNPRKWGLVTCEWNLVSRLVREGGFSQDQLVESGLFRFGDQGQGTVKPSACMKPGRLIVPYISGGQLVGFKSRVSLAEELDAQSIKYLSAPGISISQYLWHVTNQGQDLYLTEGELKAITGLELGVSCVSISGLQAWRRTLPSIKQIAKRYVRVFIVLDSDPGYQRSIPHLTAATKLYSELPNSCILFLPQVSSDTKQALDSYLLNFSTSDFLGLSNRAWSVRDKLFDHWRGCLAQVDRPTV